MIENFHGKIENRDVLIRQIGSHLETNKDKPTPWDKYHDLFTELDYICLIEENRKKDTICKHGVKLLVWLVYL